MAKYQEGVRKDAERAFRAVQGKRHVWSRTGRYLYTRTMQHITLCCVVLYNIMVKYRLNKEGVADAESCVAAATVGDEARPM